jgi:thioesterase domain-containing protein/acyl carrier protein
LATFSLSSAIFQRPRDIVEMMLVEIWQELLGTGEIGIKDDFFDLGGDSLRAVQMVTRVETEFGVRLPLASMFGNATIEALASALRELTGSSYDSPLIRIQSGISSRPLFFFHGDFTGGGFHCLKLAKRLGPDQTFYAVQPHGLPGQPIPSSIEEMAEAYLAHILAVDTEGPYRLSGHCNGALVALEVARRLLIYGKRIGLLLLIDPPSIGFFKLSGSVTENTKLYSVDLISSSMSSEAKRSILMELYFNICTNFSPKYYPGKLTFILSSSMVKRAHDSTLGWRKMCEKLDVHIIPGGHLTIMTHNLEKLAKLMRASLNKVKEEPE